MSMMNVFPVRAGVECMVGWDAPMGTFFGQVYAVDQDGERAEDEPILWVGSRAGEIRTVDELVERLKPQATIPKDIRDELFAIEVD